MAWRISPSWLSMCYLLLALSISSNALVQATEEETLRRPGGRVLSPLESLIRVLAGNKGLRPVEQDGRPGNYDTTSSSSDNGDDNRDSLAPRPNSTTGADYICVQPKLGLKLVEKDQCFPPCKPHCAESLASGFLHLSCLASECLPFTTPQQDKSDRASQEEDGVGQGEPWIFQSDRFPVGIDEFPSGGGHRNRSSPSTKPRNGFALGIHPLTSWRRYVRFNLTTYRTAGLSFSFFSAQISLVSDGERAKSCSAEDDGFTDQSPDETITFAVLSNRGRLYSHSLQAIGDRGQKIDLSIHIPASVTVLRLQVYRSQRRFPLGPLCHRKLYGVWSQASLTDGRPILPACGKQCRLENGGVFLACLMGGCSGTALTQLQPSHYARIEKFHARSRICVDCTSSRRRNHPVSMAGAGQQRRRLDHFIGAHGDSRVVFDLSNIRQLVADDTELNMFQVTVGLGDRARRKCLSRLRSPLARRAYKPMTFKVYLDQRLVRSVRFDVYGPARNLSIPVAKSRRTLTLEVLAGTGSRLCSEAVWARPRLEYSSLHEFPACNRDCADDFERAQFPLSCVLGRDACPGRSVRNGSEFARVGPAASWGVGVDTAGDWTLGSARSASSVRRRIRFSGGRKSFKRGLGLHAPGSVEFDLAAMRRAGLQFNFLHVVVGLDVNSLLPRCASYALTMGGEARIYGDGRMLGHWMLAHQYTARPARPQRTASSGAVRARSFGSGHEVYVPVGDVSTLRLVARNPMGSLCSHVAFGDAKLISLDLS